MVAGASAINIKRGLDRATKRAIEALRALSRPVTTRKEKAQVGTISAHNDSAIGELVAGAMDKVGSEGVITVEESKTTETALDVVEGMQFDRGFLLPYFVTNPDKMEAAMEDCLILLSDRKVSSLNDMTIGAKRLLSEAAWVTSFNATSDVTASSESTKTIVSARPISASMRFHQSSKA